MFYDGEPSGPLGKGIDVKRHGRGFVVAAPAGHISGGKYTWQHAPWDTDVERLPSKLQGKRDTDISDLVGGDDLDDLIGEIYKDGKAPNPIPIEKIRLALTFIDADDYHQWVNIGHALKHAYEEEGESLWLEWSKTSEKYEEGDEAKWETLDKNRDRPLVTIRSIMSLARRNGYRPLATEFDKTFGSLADISHYVDHAAPPIDWVFEPCIPAGKVVLIAGAGGSSKSYFALTLSISLATGKTLGSLKPSEPGYALMLVAEESKDDIHRRVRNIMAHEKFSDRELRAIKDNVGILSVRGMDWRLMKHDDAGDLEESDRVDYLIDEVKGLGCKLLVVDPLIFFNGAAENDNIEMARMMATLDRIAEKTGAAVLCVHHSRKIGPNATLDDLAQGDVRGASAIVDNVRGVIMITRMPIKEAEAYGIKKEEAARFVLARVVKNNYGPYTKDVIFAVGEGGALRYAPEVVRTHSSAEAAAREMDEKDAEDTILVYLLDKKMVSRGNIEKASGKSKPAVNRYLKNLVDLELVDRAGFGKSSEYFLTSVGKKKAQKLVEKPTTDIEDLL